MKNYIYFFFSRPTDVLNNADAASSSVKVSTNMLCHGDMYICMCHTLFACVILYSCRVSFTAFHLGYVQQSFIDAIERVSCTCNYSEIQCKCLEWMIDGSYTSLNYLIEH